MVSNLVPPHIETVRAKRKSPSQPGRATESRDAPPTKTWRTSIADATTASYLLPPLLAAATLAGMLCSARLWVSSHRLFPMTPVWGGLPQPPFPLDYILFGLALASLLPILVWCPALDLATAPLRSRFRIGASEPRALASGTREATLAPGVSLWKRPVFFIKVFLILAAVLVAFDQSRLQPWLLEYCAMFGALLCLPWNRPRDKTIPDSTLAAPLHACRWLMIWTYFYSGIQKIGFGFVSVLASMAAPMITRFHWSNTLLSMRVLRPAALVLALAECISGVLLAFPKTRRLAVVTLTLMHISLLLWLGPLALGWNSVVWPWNVAMIALLFTLFWAPGKWGLGAMWNSHPYAKVVAVTFGVLPVLTILGITDSYAGFSLYSGNIKGAVVYVGPQHVSDLPDAVRPYAKQDGILDLDSWSASELGVPLYPETRVFASAGRQVALWVRSGAVVRVIELAKPDPLTGQRKATSFDPMTY